MPRMFCAACCVLWGLCLLPAVCPAAGGNGRDESWAVMPAGARTAFFGLHGGTMPVSLLVTRDGTSLVTFVGRTGNDFMEILRRSEHSLPTFFRAGRGAVTGPSANATTVLMAGSSSGSLPVFNIPGEGLWRVAAPDQLQPFGLSDTPLSIEGEVRRPARLTPAKPYPLPVRPQYLQPRRSGGQGLTQLP